MDTNARPATRRHLTGDRNQCPTCGAFFNSTYAFDAHRTGPFGGAQGEPSRRRCLTVDEMRAKGMTLNQAGFWMTARRGLGPKPIASCGQDCEIQADTGA
ncbi:hypothetical protein [Paraburkholderia adhaesiva]|uniref:hypothetical protein n=1 Tax=Paraburkholderia adhaesiva TaxID=2883244 RepID=UPI001F1C3EAA|nr:hypothetical protein [Paraburkholderia adhaesiva]